LRHLPNGSAPLVLASGKRADECCGEWTPDDFLFTVLEETRGPLGSERATVRKTAYKPTRLTTGPLDFLAAVLSRNGKKAFAIGVQTRYELRKYDFKTRENTPCFPGTSAHAMSSSADGRWVAYVEEHGRVAALWRSKSDGRDRLQLTQPPMITAWSQWARDGEQIAFMGRKPDKPWNIYVVPQMR
jgi:Tol biopolymer transport system component